MDDEGVEPDVVDLLWQAAGELELRGCPDPATRVLAALNGPDDVSEDVWLHLAIGPCEVCESELTEIWRRRHPPADILALSGHWLEESPLASALARLSEPAQEAPPREIPRG